MHNISWQKSSFSMENGNNDCIEFARIADEVLLRESDEPTVIATANPARFRALLLALKRDAFDQLP